MELLTGLEPEGAMAHIAWLGIDATTVAGVPAADVQQTLQGLHEAMEGLWRDAVEAQHKRRVTAERKHAYSLTHHGRDGPTPSRNVIRRSCRSHGNNRNTSC